MAPICNELGGCALRPDYRGMAALEENSAVRLCGTCDIPRDDWAFVSSYCMFPWIMTGAALLFFDPDWPNRLLQRLRGHGPESSTSPPISMASPTPNLCRGRVRLALLLAVLFFAVQAMVPMSASGLPWKREMDRRRLQVLWRVLVTEKTGLVKFRVTSQSMETERLVHPEDFLTPTQVNVFRTSQI